MYYIYHQKDIYFYNYIKIIHNVNMIKQQKE